MPPRLNRAVLLKHGLEDVDFHCRHKYVHRFRFLRRLLSVKENECDARRGTQGELPFSRPRRHRRH